VTDSDDHLQPDLGADAADWDAAYSDDVPTTPVDADLKAVAAKLTPGTALDLGCGAGHNSVWLALHGWTVLGIDFAEQAVELARMAARTAGADVTFETADVRTWKPPQTYDFVISTYALPPVGSGREHALAVATAAVAPGGTILVAEFDVSLAATGWMAAENLASLDELTTAVAGFDIALAELRVTHHAHGEDSRDLPVACVVARQPGQAGA
jgi:2-polyprenyl-3-methyl-5-hydroxy-6-metoxy-1,4-benzoquinol methylase